MKTVVKMENVSYKKQDCIILNSINLEVNEGEFISLLGSEVAGKTSLIDVIIGKNENFEGSAFVYAKSVRKNRKELLSHIGFVPDYCNNFSTNKVSDELIFSLRNMDLSEEEINSRIKDIVSSLNIKYLLDCIPSSLSSGEKSLVTLASILVTYPDILIIDESLEMIDGVTRDKALKLIKKLSKKNNMTVIYATENADDILYSDRVILLSNGKVYLDSKIRDAFKDEKIYREVGIQFPFMVDLSNKLKYYGLVDNIEFNMDKLVNKLWK